MKRPAFQFYPGDWLRATELRSCSVGARGLWIDMICLMHEGCPYGHLKVGEKVILPTNLARMVGATIDEVHGWLDELSEANVFSRDDAGCIFSRRMVRDEKVRRSRAEGGKLGGNPALISGGAKVNHAANLQATPASASASASANQGQPRKRGDSAVGLKSYLDNLKAKGEKFIQDDDPIWVDTEAIGLSTDMLRIAFLKFKDRFMDGGKRYVDWRRVFRRSVKERWMKLWYLDEGTGKVNLTNDGLLAMRQFKDDAVLRAAA